MKENIKTLLLGGCAVSHPYKGAEKSWMITAKIFIYAGIGSKPKVIIDGPTNKTRWEYDELDAAIDHYISFVFTSSNLAWLLEETMIELNNKGEYLDLDDEPSYKKVRKLVKEKIANRK